MLGLFRFGLAVTVMVSHLYPVRMPFNLGASAVVAFYFLSGFLMEGIYRGIKDKSRLPALSFYVDRLLRTYPLYILVTALIFVGYAILGLGNPLSAYGSDAGLNLVANLLIVPLNYYFLAPVHGVVATGFSLGTEYQFYLAVPLLMFIGRRALYAVVVIMCAGQIMGLQTSGSLVEHLHGTIFEALPLNSDSASVLLAYILPIFGGAPFVLGMLFAHSLRDPTAKVLLWSVWGVYVVYFIAIMTLPTQPQNPYFFEVTAAIVAMVPVAHSVAQPSRSRADRIIGSMAYPLFLCHMFFVEIAPIFFSDHPFRRLVFIVVCSVMSAAVLAFTVEPMVRRMRYAVRGFGPTRPRMETAPANTDH